MRTVSLPVLSLVATAVAFACGTAQAEGYGLANANRDKINKKAWECKRCLVSEDPKSSVTLGASYQQDEPHLLNSTGNDVDGAAAYVSAKVVHKTGSGYRLSVDADKLGYDAGRAEINVGKPGSYGVRLAYQGLASFDSTGMSPFAVQGDELLLPSNWQTGATSADMPGLTDANAVLLEKKRQRFSVNANVEGDKLQGKLDYRHETRDGHQRGNVNLLTNSAMVARPIDDSTDSVDARLYMQGEGWLAGMNAQMSQYRNDHTRLYWNNPFQPTFGDAIAGQNAVAPDNKMVRLALDSQLHEAGHQVLMHAGYSSLTQDEDLLPATINGASPVLPVASADAKVNITDMSLRYNGRITNELSVRARYSYLDRDNQTQIAQFPIIVTDSLDRGLANNVGYDRTRQKLDLGAKYRFNRDWSLDTGYRYDHNNYSGLSRDSLFESSLYATLAVRINEDWKLRLKGEAADRNGSDYNSQSNAYLRQSYLADRERQRISLEADHRFGELGVQFAVRSGREDYDNSLVGLTDVRYTGLALSAQYPLSENLSLHGFANQDWRDSDQAGSTLGSTPNWKAEIRDRSTAAGLGLDWAGLMDNRLALGLDYQYADGQSDTNIEMGLESPYGDYDSVRHTLKAHADYSFSERMSLRLDWLFESYEDRDWSNDGLSPSSIPNVILLGDLGQDYSAHYLGLSLSYRW
ncbi:MtrB/PioB family decaheme-associated outer membrane protein [Shewanella cyperi]|uniref:MtrB/PioB family decaheme-associated outer membrane protein n=1 Tax=Shewanella cyperi TaxID=2814292 RepID=UPI001A94487D|nr:MtrB/PioB family decaheme-associated outer membrane protein [Shewanella cyperi]QSX42003.1 MtrB/PioB family decaheme-associated outer membrane protein [Shewanella cyperi]